MSKNRKISTLRYVLISSLLVVGIAGLANLLPRSATAACTTSGASYGSGTLQLSVPTAGEYRIWTHINAPDTNSNSLLLEIDGNSCYLMGDSTIPANTWTWIDHQNASLNSKVNATLSAGAHTIKVIGREPGVKLDRVLAVGDQNCIPSGQGANCMVSADTVKPTVTITAPAEGATVAGMTPIKVNANDNTSISKVEFYIQNNLVATDTSSPYEYNWDVSGLANGTYTLSAKAYDQAGNTSTDIQAVTVKNGDTEAPSAPSNLTASGTTNKVNLNWKASTDNTSVTAYRVVRNDTVIATTTSPSYTDSSVAAGSAYNYYILAVDGNNNVSNPSNKVIVNTPAPPVADTQAPSKPTDVTATAASASQITVAWKPSTDNVGIKEYDLYRAQGSGNATKIATTTNTSYGDGSLSSNTTYSYYVIARDAANNSSSASSKVTATTNKPPAESQGKSTLRGTVQGRNGRPIAGAKVTIWIDGKRYQATTNWRGRYIMTNIPSGRYEASFRAWGYERKTTTLKLSPGKTKWQDVTLRR